MKSKNFLAAIAAATTLMATPLFAADIMVKDPYIRTSTPSSTSGAAFLELMNQGDTDDRLIGASTEVAERVELHTNISDDNGVMKMVPIEGGIALPAGGMHALKRGGDHIMLMGLIRPLEQGEEIPVTLTFEKAGDVEVVVPVDRKRRPGGHETMKHDSNG